MEQRIHAVLKMVDLEEHQNTYIRKLSGGQKKEQVLLLNYWQIPNCSSWMNQHQDSTGTEKNLMMTLSKLSKEQNKTIVMVTHTTQNLHLCDKIIFMGPGRKALFCGNVEEAKKFYQTDDLVNIYNMIAESLELWQRRFEQSRDRSKLRTKRQYRIRGKPSQRGNCKRKIKKCFGFQAIWVF